MGNGKGQQADLQEAMDGFERQQAQTRTATQNWMDKVAVAVRPGPMK